MKLIGNIKKTSVFLVACLLFVLIIPINAFAWDAILNENNDIEIITTDALKHASIYYHTEGVTITRCQYNPTIKDIHSSGEWYAAMLENAETTISGPVGRETTTTKWTISLEEVITMASAIDASWGEEIRNAAEGTGPAVYIKLDCIVFVYHGDVKYSGPYINVPGEGGNGKLPIGINPATGKTLDQAEGWSGGTRGFETHYNHYLLIGSHADPEPIELDDEFVTYDYTMDHYAGIDANQPAYAMSNYSSLFDLSKGIPSSEYIDNAFLADSWYGNTNVYARTLGQHYDWDIYYYWWVTDGYWGSWYWADQDNDGIDETYTRDWNDTSHYEGDTYHIPIGDAYIAFQFLADTHIYDFTNADIKNGAYDGDHIYYDDTEEVPMTCIATDEYKDVGTSVGTLMTEEPNWQANSDDHAVLPERFSYRTRREVNSRSDVANAIIEDRDAIRQIIYNACKTRNDKLVIDGHMFMNNDWVTGCDFFDGDPGTYRACTHSSGWVNDYCLKAGIRPLHEYDPRDVTGNVTVQIPPTVDNGYYWTSMKVFYQRLVTYSKTSTQFESGE